ncbi:ATP phosphoribosyltransferase regulatory subunit [Curvivirga sp.]|uniref:ATP phosphoribosyltransferase regulatory subunit n=1 Tax=Curvivirga sp. TaxID=2856848 RepID=UPI003B5AC2CB
MLDNDTQNGAVSLLPQGLGDQLPPEALHEAAVLDKVVHAFASMGYERVEPPLVEFEENLLNGAGQAMASHTFRLMDPVSQRMMGVRADMTPQVARIAGTRLRSVERPLRLSYAGQVLRVKGSQLRPERQFAQAGAELIGADVPEADAEVITLAVKALQAAGVKDISVDLSLPTVVLSIAESLGLTKEETKSLRVALDRKDAAEVATLPEKAAEIFGTLLNASGLADQALEKLKGLNLPAAAAAERDRLAAVLDILKSNLNGVMFTVDPVEHRGFEYQTGLSFTLFAKNIRGELGRGGRYEAGEAKEPAAGFSLYMDTVLRAAPIVAGLKRVYLPYGTDMAVGEKLREEGWATVAGLYADEDVPVRAEAANCGFIWLSGEVQEV